MRGKILRIGKQEQFGIFTKCPLRVKTIDHYFVDEELEMVGDLSKVCSHIVFGVLIFFARMGGLDILWSVSYLAGTILKWKKACGKRWARFISHIHFTSGLQTLLTCGKRIVMMHIGFISGCRCCR